jgi:predicted HicB family RNase H-like nuclease
MKALTLRLPDKLHEQLKRMAEKENRSLHNLIITILMDYVKQSKEAEKPKG